VFLKGSKQRHLGKRGECGESVNKMGCVMVRETDEYPRIGESADGEG